jgi:hypothetical protein
VLELGPVRAQEPEPALVLARELGPAQALEKGPVLARELELELELELESVLVLVLVLVLVQVRELGPAPEQVLALVSAPDISAFCLDRKNRDRRNSREPTYRTRHPSWSGSNVYRQPPDWQPRPRE